MFLCHLSVKAWYIENPQFQPHILLSSRRKENVPLTVQEERAAGGAVNGWFALPRTPRAAEGCGPYGVRLTEVCAFRLVRKAAQV